MLKSLRVYLLGMSYLIDAVVHLSIARARRALEVIGVESKKYSLITVTSSVVFPFQPGLLQAQLRVADVSKQSVSTVGWDRPPQVYVCTTSPAALFGH